MCLEATAPQQERPSTLFLEKSNREPIMYANYEASEVDKLLNKVPQDRKYLAFSIIA